MEQSGGRCKPKCLATEKFSVLVGTRMFMVARCPRCGEFSQYPRYFFRVDTKVFRGTRLIQESELSSDLLAELSEMAERINVTDSPTENQIV